MTETMSETMAWADDFSRRADMLPGAGAPWLDSLRRRGLDRFLAEGWPTTKREQWHHTSLALLARSRFDVQTGPSDLCETALAQLQATQQTEAGRWVVFVDGQYCESLSSIGVLPSGVRIEPASRTLDADPDRLSPYWGNEEHGESPAALNLAFATDGAYIHVGRGGALETPVHLVFIAQSDRRAAFYRNVIVIEPDAHATVVEHYIGEDANVTLTNAVTRTSVGANARLTHVKLQQEGRQAFHLADIDVQQAGGSVFNSHALSFGASLARTDIATAFDGQRCETLFNGLYYVDGRRQVDHHTYIRHANPNCVSREYYRGILSDSSHGVFAGRILVAEGADGTDAIQRSDSLLLSRLAKIDARPELEIYADDVKCAHGATVGQIDEESLFYLQSRGLDEAHARSILTYAFAAEALNRIQENALRSGVARAVRALLPGGELLGDLS